MPQLGFARETGLSWWASRVGELSMGTRREITKKCGRPNALTCRWSLTHGSLRGPVSAAIHPRRSGERENCYSKDQPRHRVEKLAAARHTRGRDALIAGPATILPSDPKHRQAHAREQPGKVPLPVPQSSGHNRNRQDWESNGHQRHAEEGDDAARHQPGEHAPHAARAASQAAHPTTIASGEPPRPELPRVGSFRSES